VITELLAQQRRLEASQWWGPARIRNHQWTQLRALLAHTLQSVPFYAERLRGIDPANLTEAAWSRIPVLTRREVQQAGDALLAKSYPASHGALTSVTTGGSSGIPVRIRKTALANLMWNAILVREEHWHRDDPLGSMARIRRMPRGLTPEQEALVYSPSGLMWPDYGPPTNQLWPTGQVGIMDDRVAIPDQAAFLLRLQPAYLFTFPANLRLLLAHFRDSPTPLRLRSVWTLSEIVDDSLRELCRQIFGCHIVHNYTAAEGGYLALQCPEASPHFHVQSEAVLLEVLDADGQPCRPGEVGRVVITPLHNFACPLIRYEIGDLAEVGAPCKCGRGLPVLRRIVGRAYDYLTLPTGERRRADTGYYRISRIACIREFQIVQKTLSRIEAVLVLSRELTAAEQAELFAILAEEFGAAFEFTVSVRDSIARTEAGKLRTFVSEVGR